LSKKFVEVETIIPGLTVVKRSPNTDNRGLFERLICTSDIKAWENRPIKQINRSVTKLKGVIRGLHLQKEPYSECKLITCLNGRVMDIAVDLRIGSPTYGKSFSIELNSKNGISLLVPEGCAHGFQSLTNNVEMLYIHSESYSAQHEDGINSLDETLCLNWPLACTERSERDKSLRAFTQHEENQVEV